jgi:predicted RNA-binding protein with PIN domain
MAVPLIVDGYNLLFLSQRNPDQAARAALRNQLVRYAALKRRTIYLVFDGAARGGETPIRSETSGVVVCYSSGRERADDLIRRMVAERREVVVVTSDRDLVRSVERLGAAVLSSHDFQDRLDRAFEAESGDESDGTTPPPSHHAKSRHHSWLKGL